MTELQVLEFPLIKTRFSLKFKAPEFQLNSLSFMWRQITTSIASRRFILQGSPYNIAYRRFAKGLCAQCILKNAS